MTGGYIGNISGMRLINRLIYRAVLACLCLATVSCPAAADIIAGDYILADSTVARVPPQVEKDGDAFNAKQLIAPGALLAVGIFGTYNGWCRKINHEIKDDMAKMRGDHYLRFDDYASFLTPAVYFGLGFTGVKTKHTFRERLAVEITSYVALAAIGNGMKYSFRVERPDMSRKNSFPSGHTAIAFTGAELIREEYGNAWGAGAYVVATGIAFLRMYNEKHWLTDVIGGAGVGILCARIGYWMLPLYRKWFHWDDKNRNVMMTMAPSYDGFTRTAGLSLALRF